MNNYDGESWTIWWVVTSGIKRANSYILAEARGSVSWGCAERTNRSLVVAAIMNAADPASSSTPAPLLQLHPALAAAFNDWRCLWA